MPKIEITDTQQADLMSLRENLEDVFIEAYGHIRVQDVVDYLLDTYTPPNQLNDGRDLSCADYEQIASVEYPELQHIASEVSGVPGSGIDADEMRGKLISALGATELAARLADLDPEIKSSGDSEEGAASPTNSTDTPYDGRSAAQIGISTEADPPSSTVGTGDDNKSNEIVDDIPSDTLSVANHLLTEYDEKWTQSDESDKPYEVTLPDGSTVSARTKDDVRKLLFQNY